MIIKEPLSRNYRVMYWALPSRRVPLSLIRGAVALSTSMAVLAFIRYERPIGMPEF